MTLRSICVENIERNLKLPYKRAKYFKFLNSSKFWERFMALVYLRFLLGFKNDFKRIKNGQLKMSFAKPRLYYKRANYFKF